MAEAKFLEGMPEDTKAQLLRLKDLTRRTGVVAETQVLQLKLWPYMLFNIVGNDAEAKLDPYEKHVSWDLRLKGKPPAGKDLKARGETLESWLRTLLGDEWLLDIRVRQKKGGTSKTLYKGARLQPVKGPAEPKADLPGYEFKDVMATYKRYNSLDEKLASEAIEDLPPIEVKK